MLFLRRYRAFITAFFVMLIVSLTVVTTLMRYKLVSEKRQMEYLVASKSNEITEAIFALLYKAEALSTLVIQGNGEIRDLERIAPIIMNSPVIRNVLLAPDGIVTRVYPTDTNEPLLGYDLWGPGDGNKEAHLARDSRKLTLGGPFVGVQGGQILVGRLPISISKDGKQSLWGLVSVTLNYPEALAPVRLNELDNLGFACEIWRINPDQNEKQIILRTKSTPLHDPMEKEFSLLNARWKISISPLEPWYERFSFYAILAAAILFSALIASIVQNYWEMHQIRTSLEHMAMYDSLTGLPNRRATFEKLASSISECREKGQPFILGYLDLNDFKLVNDTHGHHIGDYVLKETAKRISSAIPHGQFVGRIGGDEFLVILVGEGVKQVPAMQEALNTAMKSPMAPKLVDNLQMTLSMGAAVFPLHGESPEELTAYADAAMYEVKERFRTRRRVGSRDMTAMAFMAHM